MRTFIDLVASRKAWIDQELQPWCVQAVLKDLRQAAEQWLDVAGKVDAEKTLWYWAWSRFPALVNSELQSIDETDEVTVTLRDGRTLAGYPDARRSLEGELWLTCRDPQNPKRTLDEGPFSIDQIADVTRS